jgi:hypothetical protein
MIDFRYHLVSLVSVFLALAVGIALGAGPLKEPIGTTLTERVESLRQEKDSLRADLGTADAAMRHRDDFITTITPALLKGQLTGRSVTIVTLPGADSDAVDPLVEAITAAGGTVASRVSIGGTWIDPDRETERTKVLTELAAKLPSSSVPTTGATDVRLANTLAGALVSTGSGSSTAADATVRDALRSADLIAVKGKVTGLAGAALVLAPADPEATAKTQPTPAGKAQNEYIDLADALDTVGSGAVVTGPPSSATGEGLLAAIRGDDIAKTQVSTVDTGSTPMGVISAVLALREQMEGAAGAYGFGSGVTQPLPDVTGASS